MDKPFLVVLTGRRRAGKDTFADVLKENFPNETLDFAIADWFKEALSAAFGIELAAFYDDRKDATWDYTTTVNQHHVASLAKILSSYTDKSVAFYEDKLASHIGTEINSNRRLMEWFGFDFVRNQLGDVINCEITSRRIDNAVLTWQALNHGKVLKAIVIKDARTYDQSKWFSDNADVPVLRIRITRLHGGTNVDSGVEAATEQFPTGWFDHELTNPYPARDEYVASILKLLSEETKKHTTGHHLTFAAP